MSSPLSNTAGATTALKVLIGIFSLVILASIGVILSKTVFAPSAQAPAASEQPSVEATSLETVTPEPSEEVPTEPVTEVEEAPSTEPKTEAPAEDDEADAQIAAAERSGVELIRGTIRVFNAEELRDFQGAFDAIPESEGALFAVLVFDEPQDFTAARGADPGFLTREAQMLGLVDYRPGWTEQLAAIEAWEEYDGLHVTMIAPEAGWPSEGTLPYSQPRAFPDDPSEFEFWVK
ncbi:MAG: hypothetical protein Q4D87_02775 [Actinomycetaceae bacterium]|nr:hypothetical protein [Actinomycetaceae bacterium]